MNGLLIILILSLSLSVASTAPIAEKNPSLFDPSISFSQSESQSSDVVTVENISTPQSSEIDPSLPILFEENGLMGLKNSDGEIIAEAIYELIGIYDNGYSLVQNKSEHEFLKNLGLLDNEGNTIVVPIYQYFNHLPNHGLAIVALLESADEESGGPSEFNFGVFDYSGENIIAFDNNYNYINILHDYLYRSSDLSTGQEQLDLNIPKSNFGDDLIFLARLGDKFGCINLKGEVIIDFNYEHITYLGDNYFLAYPLYKEFRDKETLSFVADFAVYNYQIINDKSEIIYSHPDLILERNTDWSTPVSGKEHTPELSYYIYDFSDSETTRVDLESYRVSYATPEMIPLNLFEGEEITYYDAYEIDVNTPYTLIPLP